MKVLIWILTFFFGTILNTLLGYAIGIRAGSVLLYIGEYFLARKLCEKWDEHQQNKVAKKETTQIEETKKTETSSSVVVQPVISDKRIPVEAETHNVAQFCSRCGSKLVDGAKFCRKCGARVDIVTE